MAIETSKKLFSVRDYHRMAKAGILAESDRVELIRGEVLRMSPIGPRHNAAVRRATHALVKIVDDRAIVSVQGSIQLDEYDEPQPDIVLLRPRDDFYATRHANPQDTLVIIEMADTSLEYDRTAKMSLYAETGVPEYWIANLQNDHLIVFRDPHQNTYRVIQEFLRGDAIAPQGLQECRILVEVLLP
jgi:Uma2 family endonuclease